MVMTDPISDMLTRIRNALRSRKSKVEIPSSKIKIAILKILKEKGLVENLKIVSTNKDNKNIKRTIIVFLKYNEEGIPLIDDLIRISKPGRRVYMGYKELKKTKDNFSFKIVSTSRGIMTDEEAIKRKLGGEVICEIK